MRRGGTLSTPSPTSQCRDPRARIAHGFSEQLASVRRFGQSSCSWHACQLYKITSSKTSNQAIAKQHAPTSRDVVDSTGKLMKLLNFPPRADLHLILPRNTRRLLPRLPPPPRIWTQHWVRNASGEERDFCHLLQPQPCSTRRAVHCPSFCTESFAVGLRLD